MKDLITLILPINFVTKQIYVFSSEMYVTVGQRDKQCLDFKTDSFPTTP